MPAFLWIQKVPMKCAFLSQSTRDPGTPIYDPHHGHFVGVPCIQDPGYLLPHRLGSGKKGETIQNHRERFALGNPLSAPYEAVDCHRPTESKDTFMPKAIFLPPRQTVQIIFPPLPNSSDHCKAKELVKAISYINKCEASFLLYHLFFCHFSGPPDILLEEMGPLLLLPCSMSSPLLPFYFTFLLSGDSLPPTLLNIPPTPN